MAGSRVLQGPLSLYPGSTPSSRASSSGNRELASPSLDGHLKRCPQQRHSPWTSRLFLWPHHLVYTYDATCPHRSREKSPLNDGLFRVSSASCTVTCFSIALSGGGGFIHGSSLSSQINFKMAYQEPDDPNGAQNGSIPPAQPGGQQARFSRPFTLQEALPFSPFTSVMPFESGRCIAVSSLKEYATRPTDRCVDIIPTPELGAGPSSSNLAQHVPQNDFVNLNQEAANPSSTSRRLEQTLDHLQNLLSPARLTQM